MIMQKHLNFFCLSLSLFPFLSPSHSLACNLALALLPSFLLCFSLFSVALDPAKDPCLKIKCSRHKVCIAQDAQTALCISHRRLTHR